ncbi:hypothetical protein M622_15545 [Thauera terpenica 58Eu]|uniref:HTH cro/C1-type domain-containing protein n=1 Tax=Thauera terpenica 58Eu TaxID=1348657 RepID=T0AY83_9RHOO|nr:hypothetical protein M622_15545 [Thauera terpenica 58Eu]
MLIRCINVAFALSLPEEVLFALGTRLRKQRLAQSLTQRDLAHMAGLSLGALRKLESDGQCSLATLVRVVQALGLSAELDELFVLKRQSIAQMEQAQAVEQRQRAPRRKSPSSRSPSSKAAGVKIGHYVSQP